MTCVWRRALSASFFIILGACATSAEQTEASEQDQTAFVAPAEGSCPAVAMLKLANEATESALEGIGLRPTVVRSIFAARPLSSIAALDAVPQVGPAALRSLLEASRSSCSGSAEVGVISDLDDTVIPRSTPDLAKPPVPGVAALYHAIDRHASGRDGDVYYVTARQPERITGVPAWLHEHQMPEGPIETGIGGQPWIARPEKVRDIEGIFDRTGAQRFVLFGDTTHVDPEVQRDILTKHPDRMIAGVILKTTTSVDSRRVEGLNLVNDYAEAAALLYKLGTLTREEALDVMTTAEREGLAITPERMTALLDAR